ncbi:N-acetylglucosaminyl transferase component [Parasponia andersonii]|uniref:N-acetylglucosaminyl transferase component n=1 Tax=Parasponia andersonii TaxID=3476 RepID=A0A2P5AIS7_PARAD|nr:N-acetylglucosaminyl transferase component [Parasponia andersonii]
MQRYSLWSSLVADVFLGNLIGLVLLFHAESASLWVLNFADEVTNNLLRSGCVWLMGVPAGFKLNTELATVLGMISLNAVQIWSTLWIFVGLDVIFFIKALAILGIVFGVTLPAALIVDLITLATLHVSSIHCLISLLYSTQIQAIASLWRLFRGQKWNPLRQRLDSYDYTVKQHIVGSLLRFPSGIWFDIVSCRSDTSDSYDGIDSPSEKLSLKKGMSKENSSYMISFLHSNFMTLGQVALPHYKTVFSGISRSSIAASAYGVLTGKRLGSTLVADLPSPMPWVSIPCKDYWFLCRDSILACLRT